MALGAHQNRVLRMVIGEVSLLVGAGLAAGLVTARIASALVSSLLYGVAPTDPVTLAVAALVLTLVAALAGYLPARRASRMDPMTALREE